MATTATPFSFAFARTGSSPFVMKFMPGMIMSIGVLSTSQSKSSTMRGPCELAPQNLIFPSRLRLLERVDDRRVLDLRRIAQLRILADRMDEDAVDAVRC